jgi:hypothetical protein
MHSPLQTQQPEQRCWPMTSTVSEIEEVLPDEDSDRTTLLNGEPLRRRVSGKSPVDEGPRRIFRQQSFGRDIGHAAAETYLITGLSFKLLRYLGYWSRLSLFLDLGILMITLREVIRVDISWLCLALQRIQWYIKVLCLLFWNFTLIMKVTPCSFVLILFNFFFLYFQLSKDWSNC